MKALSSSHSFWRASPSSAPLSFAEYSRPVRASHSRHTCVSSSGTGSACLSASQIGGPLPIRRRRSASQSAFRTPATYSSNCTRMKRHTVSSAYLAACHAPDGAV